jgi:GntR family transcriptional regulator
LGRVVELAPLKTDLQIPLHHQIKESLTLQISSGQWRPEDEVPSEAELCRHYGVSRGTIRRALADLENQGLVERRQGKGTFVARRKFEGSVLGSYTLYRSGALPHDPESRVLACSRRTAPPDIKRLLGLEGPAEVYEVERIQFMAGVPITLTRSLISTDLCPGLETKDLSQDHFYGVLEREFGIAMLRAEEYLEPVLADEYVAGHLQVVAGAPIFHVERHSFTVGDRPCEFRIAYMRGDRYRFRIDHR